MWQSLGNRVRVFWLCINPAFRWIGIVLGLVGMIALIQQEVLPHPYADYRIFDFLPTWRWQGWLIVVLLVLLASAVEALYQYDTQGKPVQQYILDSSAQPFERPRIRRGRLSTYGYPLLVVTIVALFYLYSSDIASHKMTSVVQAGPTSRVSPSATPLPTPSLSPAIFMECHMVALPLTIPPDSTLHLVGANKQYMKNNHWGFFDIPNDSDKEMRWPNEKIVKDKLKKTTTAEHWQDGLFGYRCELSNHGPGNVLYLGVPLDFNFDNEKPAIRYQPVVPSLDVGKAFAFYVLNDCPESVSVIWQDIARVETQQQPMMHEVKVLRQYSSMIDQIMVFMPSQIQWVGQQPCK